MLDNLTLDQMRVLIAVAETGSFSAAARRLGRVQSGISQAIQTLEEILRLQLFDRSGKTPVLTEAGRTVLHEARQVIQRADALRTHAETIAGGMEPELAFAVDPLFPTTILMESLRALQATFPRLQVTLLTEGLGATEQRLRDGQARFAIYSILTTGADDLEVEFLTHIAMVPVVAASHCARAFDVVHFARKRSKREPPRPQGSVALATRARRRRQVARAHYNLIERNRPSPCSRQKKRSPRD